MPTQNVYLFAFAFTFLNQSGMALITARTEQDAIGILRRQGKNWPQGQQYKIVKCRNLGIYSQDDYGIVFESYTNAMVAYDAIVAAMQNVAIISSGSMARHDTTENWNRARGFIPQPGELIVYDDYKQIDVGGKKVNVPGIKVGSGNAYVQDLAFTTDAEASELLGHINDKKVHISEAERLFWNNKLNVNDRAEVVEEALVFNRN